MAGWWVSLNLSGIARLERTYYAKALKKCIFRPMRREQKMALLNNNVETQVPKCTVKSSTESGHKLLQGIDQILIQFDEHQARFVTDCSLIRRRNSAH